MSNSFLFVILVAIVGALLINSMANLSSEEKKKLIPKFLGVGALAVAVAEPIHDPKHYVLSIVLLAATSYLNV
jgi:hypothetical protein